MSPAAVAALTFAVHSQRKRARVQRGLCKHAISATEHSGGLLASACRSFGEAEALRTLPLRNVEAGALQRSIHSVPAQT